ncbi:putative RNA exonuclease NEF-sp [Xenopus tropicalis]|uniref:LOC100158551 protein n=1 Tax=Xenopus tropicalis TaxID=8364 RepID=B2GUC2_XENTR|nr:RNA exonuclease 5 [Xenopus tropicalis]AAI66218.1 LOC100158551 protein [Xenopus tropicalis]|eukprot:NP_001121457.1 putative RNA exonuclease NEF-sp [Xenopus tropicalis]
MAEEPLMNPSKRRNCTTEDEREPKKKRVDSEHQSINGSTICKLKKSPRLSTALFRDNCAIQHQQIHKLLKYACLGKGSRSAQPSWCHIQHQKRLQSVVIIVLQDLAQLHFYQFYLHFPYLRKLFKHRFSMPPPPSDFIAALIGAEKNGTSDIKKQEFRSLQANFSLKDPAETACLSGEIGETFKHDPIVLKYGTEQLGLTRYLLSQEEMRKNKYPLVGSPDSIDYVNSGCSREITDDSPLFGLDCEMCLTDKGSELTRISLVDASGSCIMDELVKPDNTIRDYMTRYSGITRKLLLPVKTKLKDVQQKLKSVLPPDAVLVGHSLDNDLRALQMIHTSVIDTALLFAREYGRKFRLKFLAQAVLGREIQTDDVMGHCPAEDARAALNLAQYFIQHGPKKVAQLYLHAVFRRINSPNGTLPAQEETLPTKQNGFLFPSVATPIKQRSEEPHSLLESLNSYGRKIIYMGRINGMKDSVSSKLLENIRCSSEEEVLKNACSLPQLASIGIVTFSPNNGYSRGPNEMHKRLRSKFSDMMTVFAGPFEKSFCLQSVRRVFRTCGPIKSLKVLSQTYQPYISVEYIILEAAQLAVETLDGAHIDGHCIKVQRLVTEQTLDCQLLLKAMEEDPENRDVIYVSGFTKSLTEEFLQRRFGQFSDIKAIFLPICPLNGKPAKYCFLKFRQSQSATAAIDHITGEGELRCRRALTACHFHQWLQTGEPCAPREQQQQVLPEEDALCDIMESLDSNVMQVYENLPENTLCLVLFPGANSSCGSVPGFGLMGIKASCG